MAGKREVRQRAEKKFLYTSIIIFVIGTIILTSVFLHFDLFTYKSVYFEFTDYEIAVNEKIKENTHYVKTDAYGDMLIPRTQVSSGTVSYFQTDNSDTRILAFADSRMNYRLGFDLCQKCGKGWFYEGGGYLHCSVCGRGIKLEELGSETPSSDVCPVPLTEDMFEQRQSVLAVFKTTLEKNK